MNHIIIKTKSKRLTLVSRLCRLFPPVVSSRIFMSMYPKEIDLREDSGFIAKSSLGNVFMKFPKAEVHATSFAVRGFTEWRNVLIANTLCRQGDTILDIGAHIGTETLLFAQIVGTEGRVISFEPLPENYAYLKKSIELNQFDNIDLYQAAVADKRGKMRFMPILSDWSTGMGRLMSDGNYADRTIEVQALVLDHMFSEGKFPFPKLVVIDVEGAELLVLRGAKKLIKECSPAIVLEVQPKLLKCYNFTSRELFEFLFDSGYEPWEITTFGLKKADPEQNYLANWLCIFKKEIRESYRQIVRSISRKLKFAAFLPLIKRLNPAVVQSRQR